MDVPASFVEDYLLYCVAVALLSKIDWRYLCLFPEFSILFHWYIYLFFCLFVLLHIPYYLDDCCFRVILKLGSFPALFFNIVVGILFLSHFFFFFVSIETLDLACWYLQNNLVGFWLDHMESIDKLGRTDILSILNLPVYEHGISVVYLVLWFHSSVSSVVFFK